MREGVKKESLVRFKDAASASVRRKAGGARERARTFKASAQVGAPFT